MYIGEGAGIGNAFWVTERGLMDQMENRKGDWDQEQSGVWDVKEDVYPLKLSWKSTEMGVFKWEYGNG